jgi:hypothetical protein
MPTKEEWIRVHADLMEKLKLPCKLRFTDETLCGMHDWEDDLSECRISVNPRADFRVPEHLIIHEAAHHRVMSPLMAGYFSVYEARDAGVNSGECCHTWSKSHCMHWAWSLRDMYKETGITLPRTTGFEEFARAAGIVLKKFSADLHEQMNQVARNPHLIEGA